MLPRIGLSANHLDYPCRTMLDLRYTQALSPHAVPLLLPAHTALAAEYAACCDALLLTGGVDLAPALYHQTPLCKGEQTDPLRDAFEAALLEAFLRARKPVFGICRGLQMINVYLGGTLVQDLPMQRHTTLHRAPNGDAMHAVKAQADCFLAPILQEEHIVNSAHHQAADRLGQRLQACAFAPDGTVEALCDPTRRIYAVQWHPERLPDHKSSARLFSFFARQCL